MCCFMCSKIIRDQSVSNISRGNCVLVCRSPKSPLGYLRSFDNPGYGLALLDKSIDLLVCGLVRQNNVMAVCNIELETDDSPSLQTLDSWVLKEG
jgi:hypothetical protein